MPHSRRCTACGWLPIHQNTHENVDVAAQWWGWFGGTKCTGDLTAFGDAPHWAAPRASPRVAGERIRNQHARDVHAALRHPGN